MTARAKASPGSAATSEAAKRPKVLTAPTPSARPPASARRPGVGGRRSEGRQIVRQWRLLLAIERSRRGLTLAELQEVADDGCTERTVYRDLAQLQQVGFALDHRAGRYRLDGSVQRLLPVTPSELVALTVAERLAAPLAGSWLAASFRALRESVGAHLTAEGRAFARELLRTVAVAAPDAVALGPRATVLDTLRDAIDREHRVRIVHKKPREAPRERLVEPYATLRAVDGSTYLVARCLEARAMRTFHVARIDSAAPVDEAFDRDPDFDLEAYVASAFEVFHGPVVHVVLEVSDGVVHLFEEHSYHPTQRVRRRRDGSARVELDAGGLEAIARFVARFGGDVRVVEPEALRRMVVELHEAGARANSADAG